MVFKYELFITVIDGSKLHSHFMDQTFTYIAYLTTICSQDMEFQKVLRSSVISAKSSPIQSLLHNLLHYFKTGSVNVVQWNPRTAVHEV